jgi:hypothetical protein
MYYQMIRTNGGAASTTGTQRYSKWKHGQQVIAFKTRPQWSDNAARTPGIMQRLFTS